MQTPKTSLSKKGFTWLFSILFALIVITGGVYLWAYLSTDTSLIARGIMWGDSDAGDLDRFPMRLLHASPAPIEFRSSDGTLQTVMADLPITNGEIGTVDMPLDEYLAYTNTTAFIVLHGDQMLYEAYFNGANRETMQPSFSITKSFTSTLIGIAIEEGWIQSLDDSITDYLPELVDRDARFKEITVRHLLTMTSGLRWERSEANPFSDDFITYYSPDLRATIHDVDIIEAPGERFQYNDYNPLFLGMILERATGISVSQYMETRLWQAMGSEGDGSWSLDSEQSGFEKMFVGVNGRAIDLVKLGWLFLNNGRNGEAQVVPAAWVGNATTAEAGNNSRYTYGYSWWIDQERKMYFAEGDKCQFIVVYPQAELVLARFGTDCGGTGFSDFIPNVAIWIESQLED